MLHDKIQVEDDFTKWDQSGGVEVACGNVFADLGLPNVEGRFAKAKLATEIAQLIDKRGWTQLKLPRERV